MEQGDDDYKGDEKARHVNNRENPIDGDGWVQVCEVIDGSKVCVPWDEETRAEHEVDKVGEVEGVGRLRHRMWFPREKQFLFIGENFHLCHRRCDFGRRMKVVRSNR